MMLCFWWISQRASQWLVWRWILMAIFTPRRFFRYTIACLCTCNLTIKEMSNGKCAALNALGRHSFPRAAFLHARGERGKLYNSARVMHHSFPNDTQFEKSVRVRAMFERLSFWLRVQPRHLESQQTRSDSLWNCFSSISRESCSVIKYSTNAERWLVSW